MKHSHSWSSLTITHSSDFCIRLVRSFNCFSRFIGHSASSVHSIERITASFQAPKESHIVHNIRCCYRRAISQHKHIGKTHNCPKLENAHKPFPSRDPLHSPQHRSLPRHSDGRGNRHNDNPDFHSRSLNDPCISSIHERSQLPRVDSEFHKYLSLPA